MQGARGVNGGAINVPNRAHGVVAAPGHKSFPAPSPEPGLACSHATHDAPMIYVKTGSMYVMLRPLIHQVKAALPPQLDVQSANRSGRVAEG